MNFPILDQAIPLWQAGGWAMIPLALNALLLCSKAVELRLALGSKGYLQGRWRVTGARKSGNPSRRELERDAAVARKYLDSRDVDLAPDPTFADISNAFEEVRAGELPPIDRDLRFLKIAMGAAPLWGLLGTVSGMLATFAGIAAGGGGDKTMDRVAGGISEALITTQTGLMVAIPGYFFHYYLSQHRARFEIFLANLESALTQHLFHLSSPSRETGANPNRREDLEQVAASTPS